jgi:hydrogenase 3 maturation protease
MLMTRKQDDGLKEALAAFVKGAQRIVICCVGNAEAGDDGAGTALAARMDHVKGKKVCVLECGQRPDSFIGDMAEFAPSHILIVDAADMGVLPGDIRIVGPGAIRSVTLSTHAFMADALMAELATALPKAKVAFLCIQAKDVSPGKRMSVPVEKAVVKAATMLTDVLKDAGLVEPT